MVVEFIETTTHGHFDKLNDSISTTVVELVETLNDRISLVILPLDTPKELPLR